MRRERSEFRKLIVIAGTLFLAIFLFCYLSGCLTAEASDEEAQPHVIPDEIIWNGGSIEIPLDLTGMDSSELYIWTTSIRSLDENEHSDYMTTNCITDYDNEKAVMSIVQGFNSCDQGILVSEAGDYEVTVTFSEKSGQFTCRDTFTLVNPVTSQLWDTSYEYVDFDGTQDVTFHFKNGTNYYRLSDIPRLDIYIWMGADDRPVLYEGEDYIVDLEAGTVTIDKTALSDMLNSYYAEGNDFNEKMLAVNAFTTTEYNYDDDGFYMNVVDYVGPDPYYMTDCAWQIDISGFEFTSDEPGDINADGNINLVDLMQCLNHVGRKELLEGEALKAADINEDGSVNLVDLMRLLNYVGRKSSTL